jgi:hypothetical protein
VSRVSKRSERGDGEMGSRGGDGLHVAPSDWTGSLSGHQGVVKASSKANRIDTERGRAVQGMRIEIVGSITTEGPFGGGGFGFS